MGVEKKEFADAYDLDDTLFARNFVIRAWSHLKARLVFRKDPTSDLVIGDFNHRVVEGKIPTYSWEMVTYMAHMGRRPISRMVEILMQNQGDADIFILTGRSSGSDWVEGTRERLAKAGILRLLDGKDRLLFTPGGKPTALSKIHALSELQERYHGVRMTDDDWKTVHTGATVLPDVVWRYVYHGFPCVYPSKQDMQNHPNISVVDLTTCHQ